MSWDETDKALFILLFIIVNGIVILIALIIALCMPIMVWQTGQGEHTGIVTASDKEGIIWKTWTIYFKTDAQSSQEDKYCVINENIIAEIRKAQETKRQVTIQYEDYLFVGLPLCEVDTGAIITGVKE
jgi:hypothetical protein